MLCLSPNFSASKRCPTQIWSLSTFAVVLRAKKFHQSPSFFLTITMEGLHQKDSYWNSWRNRQALWRQKPVHLWDVLNILDWECCKELGGGGSLKGEKGHREQKLNVEFSPISKRKTSGDILGHSGNHSPDTKCMHSTFSGMSALGMSFWDWCSTLKWWCLCPSNEDF